MDFDEVENGVRGRRDFRLGGGETELFVFDELPSRHEVVVGRSAAIDQFLFKFGTERLQIRIERCA